MAYVRRRYDVADTTLEERVTTLETLVAELMHAADMSGQKKDWRRTVGMFDHDLIMQEIIEEGRRIREADRRQADV
jgi:hypothetical protein